MRSFVIMCFVFLLNAPVLAGGNNAGNWILDSSNDGHWIKTVNTDQDELLVAYYDNDLQLLLILKSDKPLTDKILPVSIHIDRGPGHIAQLRLVEQRPGQTIMRVELNSDDKDTYLPQMIAGMTMFFDISNKSVSNAYKRVNEKFIKPVSFSLTGFTVALNDLFIVNDIGSLDHEWLLHHNKDRELFCLMTANISVEAMQYRLKGESYDGVLHLIEKTGYSIIDHNLGEIIEQVYKIPRSNLPYVPRAEKYLMFSNCMEQPFH